MKQFIFSENLRKAVDVFFGSREELLESTKKCFRKKVDNDLPVAGYIINGKSILYIQSDYEDKAELNRKIISNLHSLDISKEGVFEFFNKIK